MYFLWRNTPYGLIRISYDGFYSFVSDVMKSKLRLYSITLSPSEQDANLTIVISDENLKPETKQQVEEHFANIMASMGMKTLVVWASPERGILPVIQSPYTWAAVASCSAVIVTAGGEGFFWTAFWGAATWFIVRWLGMLAKKFRSAN